jgi:hypothetical protein
MNNITTAINTTALINAARARVESSLARKAAFEAFDAAQSLSKRNKSRDLLIAATKPAYEAAKDADEKSYEVLAAAKAEALAVIDVALLDSAVDAALQRASARLNVDFHRVAGIVEIARAFRRSVEQKDWKQVRSIVIDNATGFGEFDGIRVNIQAGYTSALSSFEVEFSRAYVDRDGNPKVTTFSPVRVTAEGFNLTSTNLPYESIDAHAFSKAWKAAEVLADVIKAFYSADAHAARDHVDQTIDAVLKSAE